MGYVYSGLWFIMAVVLLAKFRKESKMVYVLGTYFIFLGAWWLADQLVSADMLHGTYGWVLRGVSLAAVVISGVVYYFEKLRKTKAADAGDSAESAELGTQEG